MNTAMITITKTNFLEEFCYASAYSKLRMMRTYGYTFFSSDRSIIDRCEERIRQAEDNEKYSHEFYTKFWECYTLADQLDAIRTTPFDLYSEEYKPTKLCKSLMVENAEDAMEAAKVMIYRFGNIIIDRNLWYSNFDTLTLVDVLSSIAKHGLYYDGWENDEAHIHPFSSDIDRMKRRCKLLSEAFIKLGMRRASEYDDYVLQYIYHSDMSYIYGDTTMDILCGMKKWRGKYGIIGMDMVKLHREIIEYLHQPRLIAKWIESGDNELEDYLK